MSILAATPLAVAQSDVGPVSLYVFTAVIAVVAAFATGLLRKDAVSGPSRLPEIEGATWRLLFSLSCGFMMWISVQMIYGSVVRMQMQKTAPAAAVDESMLRPGDWAFLATVPYVVGFLTLLLVDAFLLDGSQGIERLGLRRHPLAGALKGAVGILIAWPLLQLLSAATEMAYDRLHYAHPQEHELLKALGESPNSTVRVALIIGAVILAPLFEEYVFRAHIQTFLRELLIRATRLRAGWTVPQEIPATDVGTLEYARPPRSGAWSQPVAWQSWLAIFIASVIFTSVHPMWMWPPIFFLALCLGYAYERTGNLWTTIVMHGLFNAVNTLAYLSLGHGG
jgi:membrane protease YdiL (CAAX protease family)